jgi:hypothetical protein
MLSLGFSSDSRWSFGGSLRKTHLSKGVILLAAVGALLAPAVCSSEISYAKFQLLAVAPRSGSTVVRLENGTLRLVRAGENVADTKFKLIEVLGDRVVVEGTRQSALEESSRKVQAWVYLVEPPLTRSRIEYLDPLSSPRVDVARKPLVLPSGSAQPLPEGGVVKLNPELQAADDENSKETPP